MADQRTLVLLGGAQEGPEVWDSVRAELEGAFSVVTPDLGLQSDGRSPGSGSSSRQSDSADSFSLDRAAGDIAASLEGAGVSSAVVCGVGLGAMVGMELAAGYPERVGELVLVTRRLALSPLLMSLPAVVVRLLPAGRVQHLGALRAQVLALLDQVRPVDFRPLAARVAAPATVLCGARDRNNRHPSEALARALPAARLELIAGAGASWVRDSPHLLAERLLALAAPPG